MSDKLVSVIMNCFNGEEFLHDAIDSVLAQTYQNWELIFWDNQSNDLSAEIFKKYKDSRLKYYYSNVHYEIVSKARNQAIAKSKGEFISFLDVDDIWLPEKLQIQLKLFENEDIDFLCSNYFLLNERKKQKKIAFKFNLNSPIVTNKLLKNYYVALVTLVIKKNMLEKLNYIFDEEYHIIGDFDLVLRISTLGKLGYIAKPVALLRLHKNNVTNKNSNLLLNEFSAWIQKNESTEISKFDGFQFRKDWLKYTSAIYKIMDGDKKTSFKLFLTLPFGQLKLRLFIALLLPLALVKKIKN
tara:strand:- start:246 stop:1139 length:894 start_codon:yes stop_codon:yes gene_type:complete